MISLQKVDNAIKFTFTDSQHYLYGDGVIAVPVNSLLLVEDKSDAVTFKKIDGDVFVSAPVAEFGMSKAEIEAFYKENMVGSTGGGGDITSGEVQTMIDASISGKADVSSLATVATTGDYDDLLNKPTIPTVPTSNTAFTNDAGYITEDALSGYAESSAVTAVNDVLTAHTANTTIHVTAGDKLTWDGKQDALTAGSGITISGNVISADGGGVNVVQTTGTSTTDVMSQNAVTNALNSKGDSLLWDVNSTPLKYAELRLRRGVNTLSDAKLNLGDYLVYGSPVSSALNITGLTSESSFTAYTAATDAALSGKQDALVSGTNIKTINNESLLGSGNITISGGGNNVVELTQAQYDALVDKDPDAFYIITDAPAIDLSGYAQTSAVTAEITAAVSGKQDTLVSGTNIKTINNESLLGSGNIVIQGGGGGSYSAGTNISIDTGNTISCTLNLTNGGGTDSLKMKNTTNASGSDSFSVGSDGVRAQGISSFAGGSYSESNGFFSFAFGRYARSNNYGEASFGYYNASNGNSSSAGQSSGNTLFSVGNGISLSGKHNAFEIRQNGDIYITSGGTDIKLQDNLGGGGGAASSAITSGDTNAVAGGAVYDQLDGLKLKKVTQAEYDALVSGGTVDSNTLYVITNVIS